MPSSNKINVDKMLGFIDEDLKDLMRELDAKFDMNLGEIMEVYRVMFRTNEFDTNKAMYVGYVFGYLVGGGYMTPTQFVEFLVVLGNFEFPPLPEIHLDRARERLERESNKEIAETTGTSEEQINAMRERVKR